MSTLDLIRYTVEINKNIDTTCFSFWKTPVLGVQLFKNRLIFTLHGKNFGKYFSSVYLYRRNVNHKYNLEDQV